MLWEPRSQVTMDQHVVHEAAAVDHYFPSPTTTVYNNDRLTAFDPGQPG